jgi:hypothetical protein
MTQASKSLILLVMIVSLTFFATGTYRLDHALPKANGFGSADDRRWANLLLVAGHIGSTCASLQPFDVTLASQMRLRKLHYVVSKVNPPLTMLTAH